MRVRLVNAPNRPFDNVVAAARSCYSKTPFTAEMATGDHLEDAVRRRKALGRRDRIARSVYEAGHHTTYQHAYLQFIIEGVSRHALWCFLHSHQFYNSEQVSQRYVEVEPDAVYVPPELTGAARSVFEEAVQAAHATYRELSDALEPIAEAAILTHFPTLARPVHQKRLAVQRRRKAQEVARYVLPLATTAHLHHTISALTLLRYHRAVANPDAPGELRALVGAMVDELLRVDPGFAQVLEEPLPELPVRWRILDGTEGSYTRGAFRQEFDARLGDRSSALLSDATGARSTLADAVRTVLGMPRSQLPDEDAVVTTLDAGRNPLLAETLNLSTLDPLTRALHQVTFTFATKISHTADSQNQRHRMVPGARPVLAAVTDETPDYIVPALIAEREDLRSRFVEAMEAAWAAAAWLRRHGPEATLASYLLPNAVTVRLMETSDLLHLHHKMRMRLCWNAQDEIRRAAWEQAMQIAEADPLIGSYLLPPCGVRLAAGRKPYCPEGDRFCGVAVWKLRLEDQRPDS